MSIPNFDDYEKSDDSSDKDVTPQKVWWNICDMSITSIINMVIIKLVLMFN